MLSAECGLLLESQEGEQIQCNFYTFTLLFVTFVDMSSNIATTKSEIIEKLVESLCMCYTRMCS